MTRAPRQVPDRAACRETAQSIARVQLDSGAIPWFPDGHTDPWDHVQSAMALSSAGLIDEAVRAYRWSRDTQRGDGSWASKYVGDEVTDASTDANFCAYLATGVWHHWLVTGDLEQVRSMWPAVRRGIGAVLSLQAPGGEVYWSRDSSGEVQQEALLTGNSSIQFSLRCATALARLVGELVPEWELASDRIRHALRAHPERFADKSRYSMDWYYPVLGGVFDPAAARLRLAQRQDDFVVAGLGIRCVDDEPWVTGAETCEYALALDAIGLPGAARVQVAAMQHLRHDDGSYWTGLVYTDGERWPVEQTTWTGATVVLAADALSGWTGGGGLFRGDGLLDVATGATGYTGRAAVPARRLIEEECSCPVAR
jgi:hypothetical protein